MKAGPVNTTDTTDKRGSAKVFSDLDIPDADAHLLTAKIVRQIDAILHPRAIAAADPSRVLSVSGSDLTRCHSRRLPRVASLKIRPRRPAC